MITLTEGQRVYTTEPISSASGLVECDPGHCGTVITVFSLHTARVMFDRTEHDVTIWQSSLRFTIVQQLVEGLG